MDLKKVVTAAQKLHTENSTKLSDSTRARLEQIRKKREARRRRQIDDSATNYAKFKKTKEYLKLKKAIKDALEDTQSTEEAVGAALEQLNPDTPAEQTLAAVVETLGETIDQLSEDEEDPDELEDE